MTGIQAAQHGGSVVQLNLMTTLAGGQLVAPDGQSVMIADNDVTECAPDTMHRTAMAKEYDPPISQSDENQARLAFDRDDTFAQANYPFVYVGAKEKTGPGNQMTKEVFEDMAQVTCPAMDEGTPAQIMIDSLNLAVLSTLKHPEFALEAIDCPYNEQNQLNDALKGGLLPTLTKLYMQATDDLKEEYPFHRKIYEQLSTLEKSDLTELTQEERALLPSPRMTGMVARPKSPTYQSLSILMASRVSPPEDVDAELLVGTPDEKLQATVNSEDLAS